MTTLEETGTALARLLRRALTMRLERREPERPLPVETGRHDAIANMAEGNDERAGK